VGGWGEGGEVAVEEDLLALVEARCLSVVRVQLHRTVCTRPTLALVVLHFEIVQAAAPLTTSLTLLRSAESSRVNSGGLRLSIDALSCLLLWAFRPS